MFRRATHAGLCVKTVFMASVPADHTRYRALRRHASEAQRQADAAVSEAVQAGRLPRIWGQWRHASAFAGCDSKVSEQVWELYGNVYCGSWLSICPARAARRAIRASDELIEAIQDH